MRRNKLEQIGLAAVRRSGYRRRLVLEPLESRYVLSCASDVGCDFGDAPFPYRTALAENGARHVADGPFFGSGRDAESDAQPSELADADESLGTDSGASGIIMDPLRVGQTQAEVLVMVGGAPLGARLDAWIDFNGDGNWESVDERVFSSTPVNHGQNRLSINVPADAKPGEMFARFRVSTSGRLGPLGEAERGEVEDIRVTILPAKAGTGLFGTRHEIEAASGFHSASRVLSPADLNGDGESEWLSYYLDTIYLVSENNQSLIASIKVHPTQNIYDAVVADIDHDGRSDLVLAYGSLRDITWLSFDDEFNYSERTIVGERASGLRLADLDGNGAPEIVVGRTTAGVEWVILRNDGHGLFTDGATLDERSSGYITFGDIDGDGDSDIVAVFEAGKNVVWFENDGDIRNGFQRHSITDALDIPITVTALLLANLDDDPELEVIISTSEHGVIVCERTGAGEYEIRWRIESYLGSVNHAADLDGDGRLDLLGVTSTSFSWWRLHDDVPTPTLVATRPVERFSDRYVVPWDMDDDGDLDLVSALSWLENKSQGFVLRQATTGPLELDEASQETIAFFIERLVANESLEHVEVVLGGTAQPDEDYEIFGLPEYDAVTGSGVVTFEPGTTSKRVDIRPRDDSIFEHYRETVTIALQATERVDVVPDVAFSISLIDSELADFGDSRAPLTQVRSDGARHVPIGPRLGALRDGELDGTVSITASGDDTAGSDDEDGIVFRGTYRPGQLNAELVVDVQDAADGAWLNVAIDFNQDGSMASGEERIAIDRWVTTGEHLIAFDIPVDAVPGETYLRARLSTQAGMGDHGLAPDGEVEDHLFTTAPNGGTGHFVQSEEREVIGLRSRSSALGDMDGDGDIDIITQSHSQGVIAIVWIEHTAESMFGDMHTIEVNPAFYQRVIPVDFDGDGDLDLFGIYNFRSTLYWFENDGTGAFTERTIDLREPDVHDIKFVDFDGDSDLDILVASKSFNRIGLYQNVGGGEFVSEQVLLGATGIALADLDGDSDLDVALSDYARTNLFLAVNDDGYELRNISRLENVHPSTALRFGDLDRDGDLDIVSACGPVYPTQNLSCLPSVSSPLAWHEHIDEGDYRTHLIPISVEGVDNLQLADLDGDLDFDMSYSDKATGSAYWLQNLGNGTFAEHLLLSATGWYVFSGVADADGDGDLDIIVMDDITKTVRYFDNTDQSFSMTIDRPVTTESDGIDSIVTITRRGTLVLPVTATLSLSGTAELGIDFEFVGSELTEGGVLEVEFAPFESSKQIMNRVLGDSTVERTETVRLEISPGDGYIIDRDSSSAELVIEDDEIVDFGDAPFPFPVTVERLGAFHGNTGPTLGALRDSEPVAQVSVDATGDDHDGLADDDGVVFGELRPGVLVSLQVEVHNAPEGAYLDVWVDFDADGYWIDYQEHVVTHRLVSDGLNDLTFVVPVDARTGETFARARLSSAGHHGIGGPAQDGEVEDYRIEILPVSFSTGLLAGPRLMENAIELGVFAQLYAEDMDLNGIVDVAVWTEGVRWYANDGQGILTPTVLTRNYSSHPEQYRFLDFDADGTKNVVGTDGSNVFWIDESDTYHAIVRNLRYGSSGAAYDLLDFDADGDWDVATVTPGEISLFVNHGSEPYQLESVIPVTPSSARVQSLNVIDFDRDDDLDFVVGRENLTQVYQNHGDGIFTTHVMLGAVLALSDVDQDGDLDILTNRGTWLEQQTAFTFVARTYAEGITLPPGDQRAIDFNGDGHLDVIVAGRALIFYGNGNGQFLVDSNPLATSSSTKFIIFDFDGDRDLDLASPDPVSGQLALYEQVEHLVRFAVGNPDTAVEGEAEQVVELRREGAIDHAVTVRVQFSGTAEYGSDYVWEGLATATADGGEVHFEAGVASVNLTLRVIDDGTVEPNELAHIALLPGAGYGVLNPEAMSITLSDNEPADVGTAPAPYPTTTFDRGAKHGASGPTLGVSRDDEQDGVNFSAIIVGEARSSLTATIQNAPDGAFLDAWIDFDRNGRWDGAQEHVARHVAVTAAGEVRVEFDIPNAAIPGSTYARIRVNSFGGLGPLGVAADGEVEDHRLDLLPPMLSSGNFGNRVAVAVDQWSNEKISAAIDLDQDGDVDLIGAVQKSGTAGVVWFEQREQLQFYRHEVSAVDSTGATNLAVTDWDLDGDWDLISNSRALTLHRNDGTQVFTSETLWSQDRLDNFQVKDVDGDGRMDIVTRGTNNKWRWLAPTGDSLLEERPVDSDLHDVYGAIVVDLDGDGDFDRVANENGAIARYLNDGSDLFARSVLAVDATGSLAVLDIHGDGLLDIQFSREESRSSNTTDRYAVFLENQGDGSFHEASFYHSEPRLSLVADLDGDGDMDLLLDGFQLMWCKNIDTDFAMEVLTPFVYEADGARAVVRIHRTASLDTSVTGRLSVFGATPGTDFVLPDLENVLSPWDFAVPFTAGVEFVDVRLTMLDDDVTEGSRKLQFQYTWPGGSLVDDVNVWLLDDDPVEFGDAPAPYPTDALHNGARHLAVGPQLGENRAAEFPTAAGGDHADDDGVVLSPITVGQFGATVTIDVRNVGDDRTTLNGWIDFDHDGYWNQVDEHIIANARVVNGVSTYRFDVPADIQPGIVYARFRIYRAHSGAEARSPIPPTGLVDNGEVEDYPVQILPQTGLNDAATVPRLVADSLVNVAVLGVIDFDHDGDGDVIVSQEDESKCVTLFENIDGELVPKNSVSCSGPSAVVRVPNRNEVLIVEQTQVIRASLLTDGSWSHVPVIADLEDARNATVFDLDGDGDLDYAVCAREDILPFHRTSFYRANPPESNHLITYSRDFQGISACDGQFDVADFNRDGSADLLISTPRYVAIMQDRVGTSYSVKTLWSGAAVTEILDHDQDGDSDILIADNSGMIRIFTNDGRGQFTSQVYFDMASRANSLVAVDLDSNGLVDIVAGTNDRIIIHFQMAPGTYQARHLDTQGSSISEIVVGDVDQDGRLDIVASSRVQRRLFWYHGRADGDFNGEGTFDVGDADLLANEILRGTHDLRFDLNDDRQVTRDDLAVWLATYANTIFGDANLDGVVDGLDLEAWSAHRFVTDTSWSTGDFNLDGVTDVRDFHLWMTNRFTTSPTTAAVATSRTPRAAAPVESIDQVFGSLRATIPRILRKSNLLRRAIME